MTVPALADYTWQGGETINDSLWGSENSWSLSDGETWSTDGSGPGTESSDMWNPISVSNASGTISGFEGWTLRLTLTNTNLTVGTLKKFQSESGSDGVSVVTLDSSSSLTINSFGGGSDGQDVTLKNDGTFAMTYGKDQGGSGFILNLGESSTTTFNLNGHTGKAQSIFGGSFSVKEGTVISGAGDGSVALDFFGSTTVSVSGDASISAATRIRSSVVTTFDVAESKTLTFSGAIQNAGELKKSGAGTMTLSADSSNYTGTVRVSEGTLKLAGKTSVLGAQDQNGTGTHYAAIVESGGTLDVNGQLSGGNNCYKIQLSGGSLINTGTNVGTSERQITGLSLTADSSVGGTGNFGVIASAYAATTVELGGHTLTKTGTNSFWLYNTTLTNGTVDIQDGIVSVLDKLTMTDSKFRINGGKLQSETANVSLGDVEIVLSDTNTAGITQYGSGSFTVGDAAKLYLDISSLALSEAEEVSIRIATANAISGDSFFSDILVGSGDETGAWITSEDWAYKADSWDASTGTLLLVSIPEPSAFGLLAGVGALALVAARRRRSRAK